MASSKTKHNTRAASHRTLKIQNISHQHDSPKGVHAADSELELKERNFVNHHVLAAGAIISILIIILMYSSIMQSPPKVTGQDSTQNSLWSNVLPAPGAGPDAAFKQLGLNDGIYFCRNQDFGDCTSFCQQVKLQPQRCVVQIQHSILDRSICACTAP